MWPDRIQAEIRRSRSHVALIGPPEYGANVVLSSLSLPRQPTVRLALPASRDRSGVLYGNLLSDALDDAFGFRLFGYGLPFMFGLSILRAQAPLLGRFTIAVTGADNVDSSVVDALLALDPFGSKVVASFESVEQPSWRDALLLIGPQDMAMTLEEARAVGAGALSDSELDRAWKATSGAYMEFLAAANRASNLPPLQLVSRPADVPSQAAEHLQSVFVRQGRWIEALEIALEHDRDQALELFRQSARIVLAQGLCDRLWALISGVEPRRFEADDELMYLYFRVAMEVNRHKSVAPQVREYLSCHEAPDLRARWAVAMPSSTSLAEAERAYNARRNVNTARALGFVMTMSNDTDAAVDILRDALEMAQSTEDERQTCAVALDTSHALTFAGQYASAKRWAHWALQRHGLHRVGDELLRLSLVTQVAYLQLLTDEPDAAEDLLATVKLPEQLVGVPMMEALISTRGDLAFIKGDLELARERYRQHYDQLALANVGFGALDLVKALVRLQELKDARRVLDEAGSLAGTRDVESANVRALEVARGHMSFAEGRFGEAIEHYRAVLYKSCSPTPFLATQAVLGLAVALSTRGETRKAISVLRAHEQYWRDLGLSGWRLLTVEPGCAQRLRRVLHGQADADTLRLLGRREMVRDGLVTRISLRHAELVALLALRQAGYRAEELLLELYGDDGKMGSLKALLSRVRRTIPIQARPYRLESTVASDVAELDDLLTSGHVREALELYKGPLLPESEAPGIRRARERIDEAVRQAVLHAGEADLALRLARKFPDDLELWEKAKELTAKDDPAYPLIRARIRRIRGEWGL